MAPSGDNAAMIFDLTATQLFGFLLAALLVTLKRWLG
jgi:hypothetical protein